jgi:hypothetical protein
LAILGCFVYHSGKIRMIVHNEAHLAVGIEIALEAIIVTRNEVEGNTFFAAKGDKIGDPTQACRCGTAHLVIGVNSLDGSRRVFVDLEILVHSVVGSEEAVEVRLVPDLEKPFVDLGFSVSRGNVAHESLDDLTPLVKVAGSGVVHLPPKDGVVSASQLAGHKTKLHHGADADVKE